MPRRIAIVGLTLGLLAAWPTQATLPPTAIVIESGSPYFVPKSVTVSSGSPILWQNPTPTEHTVTHTGCLEDGSPCAFDSGLMLPNGTFSVAGLAPGRYPYLCRIHPIMHGTIIVSESAPLPSQL